MYLILAVSSYCLYVYDVKVTVFSCLNDSDALLFGGLELLLLVAAQHVIIVCTALHAGINRTSAANQGNVRKVICGIGVTSRAHPIPAGVGPARGSDPVQPNEA